MAQFDVHRTPGRGTYPLLVDLQSDTLANLDACVVAPLFAARRYAKPIRRLNPVVTILDVEYVVLTQYVATYPRTKLGEVIGSLADRRDDLIAALALLCTGI